MSRISYISQTPSSYKIVPGPVDDVLLQGVGERLEVVVREAGADLAERLVAVVLAARQQEPAEQAGALAAAAVRAQHHRVHRVAHALQVVLLELRHEYDR
ncbi:unnamed protein product [Euphydryas editha]|uniref:Uncharacterized protein n=1 Tax=Euphydryas editha TaxID=104508 RepID=A0AAU9UD96_EUPED|nr:unnamed protein product [Euphydryas editha]